MSVTCALSNICAPSDESIGITSWSEWCMKLLEAYRRVFMHSSVHRKVAILEAMEIRKIKSKNIGNTSVKLRDGPLFPPGGGASWFPGGRKFFCTVDWALANFFPQLNVQTIFKILQISHNRGGLCRQFFFQMHLWGRQFISAIFLMQTIFLPIARGIMVRP